MTIYHEIDLVSGQNYLGAFPQMPRAASFRAVFWAKPDPETGDLRARVEQTPTIEGCHENGESRISMLCALSPCPLRAERQAYEFVSAQSTETKVAVSSVSGVKTLSVADSTGY